MKQLLAFIVFASFFTSFSQEQNFYKPLFLSTSTIDYSMHNSLSKISDNVKTTTVVINNLDRIRQGDIVFSSNNIGKSFNGLSIKTQPSLDIETQRIMFTGNFYNPFRSNIINIRQ